MGARISFEFYGDVQLDRTLERFEWGAQDASPAFEAIGDSLARAERNQFRTEGIYGSGGWDPLSPAYAAWKAKNYPGRPILQLSGDLMESLTVRPFGIDVVEAQFAVFGSGVEYGAFHQRGTDLMPRRRPVELPETLRRRWIAILQRWLVHGDTNV